MLDLNPNEAEPWGWWFKKRPDIYGFIDVEQLPPETFEPPPSPKGDLRK